MNQTAARRIVIVAGVVAACGLASVAGAQERISVEMTAGVRGSGPSPNFSPKGTQVPLTDLAAGAALPDGALRPAKAGTLKIGTSERAWVPVLVTADAAHPAEFCRLYVDRNRNGSFSDDGPVLTAEPSVREKTFDTWSSFSGITLQVPYGAPGAAEIVEPYQVSVWVVRPKDGPVPDILRYSVNSWRTGRTAVKGIDALVAMMDGNNDAVFDAQDYWSVLEASAPDAPKKVLSFNEALPTKRMMFVAGGPKELVLVFRSVTPDGRTLTFDVVDRPVTKAADRAGDDGLAPERTRPRATVPFRWAEGQKGLDAALSQARASKKLVILDYWTSWCGPCKSMDEWIWTDAEVAGVLSAGFAGVKLDGDIEKKLVDRFKIGGYPSVVILDAAGKELKRFSGYLGSKDVLAFLNGLK